MKVLTLRKPSNLYNGFDSQTNPDALAYLDELQLAYDTFMAGKLYVRFTEGDRKGSIAHLIPDPTYKNDKGPCIEFNRSFYNSSNYRIEGDLWHGLFTWDGRRNKVKKYWPTHYDECEYLIGYDGPTVWELFDAKAAKAEVLKNPDQQDIDGNVLSIGDNVLYINARYGSGMTLDHGVIKEFKAVVDSKKTEITTIIENTDGVISTLKYPHQMVCKV